MYPRLFLTFDLKLNVLTRIRTFPNHALNEGLLILVIKEESNEESDDEKAH